MIELRTKEMELQEIEAQKGDQLPEIVRSSRQLCEVVGVGRWTARIWRVVSQDRRVGYRLSLFLDGEKKRRGRSCEFGVSDVMKLPKLAQVIARSLVNDGWLPLELKDDLACMADAMDFVVGGAEELD
jgi:hypothetical protein